jgi:hypothetical protein
MIDSFLHAILLSAVLPVATAAQEQVATPLEEPLPARPPVALETVQGFAGDEAYRKASWDRAQELAAMAERAIHAVTKAELQLAAANLLLAEYFEPACSQKLNGLNLAVSEADLARDFDAVDKMLDRAGELLAGDGEGLAEERGQQAVGKLDTLRAFAEGLRAYLLAPDDTEGNLASRRAASRLSSLLESKDRGLVAAATLWHANLRSRGGDPSRGLEVLDLALADLARPAPRYDFFSRLLRCRLLAAQGGHSTALVLLLQIEERCQSWFTAPTERELALNAVALLQMRIVRDWHRLLPSDDRAEERAWCARRISTLISERLNADPSRVLRLGRTLPVIAEPPGS